LVVCLCCNKEYIRGKNTLGKYCSNKCQQEFQIKELDKRFLLGENDVFKRAPSIRKALIRRDGNECSECGTLEWNGNDLVLEVEHKDGNSTNNTSDNLCLICPNCHSQTLTYKGKNKGNGRHSRKVRYAEGKSY
jgi:RNA polymerase subunit RPABC4/transcription elongation factor Spt4